jgi:lipoprotein-anchoring transpeptidase ErfK/SrfK
MGAVRRWVLVCGAMGVVLAGEAEAARAQGSDWYVSRPSPTSPVAAWSWANRRRLADPIGFGFETGSVERDIAYGGPVTVRVSLGAQAMTVSVGGEVVYRWPISSGRMGYNTPYGSYRPQRLASMWRSKKYHNSPMPYSIFFRGGYAIHGTYATAYLGVRASHGCIRLSPAHAAALFSLVRGVGLGRTRIVITG